MGVAGSFPIPWNAVVSEMPYNLYEDNSSWKYICHVPLDHGKKYRFDCWKIGSFFITGGSIGYFTVELGTKHRDLFIHDGEEKVFSSNYPGLRVTIQDNLKGGGSSVVLSQYGFSARELPIPIRASLNENITVTGPRPFVVTGSGATLEYGANGKCDVFGHLKELRHTGKGAVRVRGSVNGDVTAAGCKVGPTIVEGSVAGSVIQEGNKVMEVNGDVKGHIELKGEGFVRVWGEHQGVVIRSGRGRALIGNRLVPVKMGKNQKEEKEEEREENMEVE